MVKDIKNTGNKDKSFYKTIYKILMKFGFSEIRSTW